MAWHQKKVREAHFILQLTFKINFMNQGKKVLIVEDEKALQQALSEKMKDIGWQPISAFNGEEGLKMLKENQPDVILLDIIMPIMDGITMLKKMKELGDTTPVIIFSNLNDSNKVAEAVTLGSFNYLTKSDCSLEDIIDKIKQVVGE